MVHNKDKPEMALHLYQVNTMFDFEHVDSFVNSFDSLECAFAAIAELFQVHDEWVLEMTCGDAYALAGYLEEEAADYAAAENDD